MPHVSDIYRNRAAKYVTRKIFNGGIVRYGGKFYTFWDSINCKGESVLVYVDRFNDPLYAQLERQPDKALALSEVA